MKTRKIIIVLLLALLGPISSFAQRSEAEAILNKSKAYFENFSSFKGELSYTLFRDKENPVVIGSYDGILVKRGDDIYLKIHNTEMLLKNGSMIKVNHDQKAMEFNAVEGKGVSQNPIDLKQYLQLFSEIDVKEEGSETVCVLTTPKYTQLPYGAVELIFDSKTGALHKQVLTLVNPGAIPNENGQPDNSLKYLAIDFKNIDPNPAGIDNLLSISSYIKGSDNAKSPASELAGYKFIDRTKK